MPTELTDGFSLAAQVSAALLRKVFAGSFSQVLPGLTATVAGGRQLTIWFEGSESGLTLLPKPLPFVNPIQVDLPFIARLSGEYDEFHGTIRIRTAVTQVRVESGGETFIAPVIDFRPNAIDSFEVPGDEAAEDLVWRPAIASVVKPALANISPFTAGPLFPGRDAQFFLNIHPDASYGPGTGVLAVYIWADGGGPPPIPSTINTRNLSADRAVALVPRDRVEQAIEAGLQANGLRDLPRDIGGVTITALSVNWRDFGIGGGHFYITGTADHTLGDVDFEAWVQLYVEHGAVRVNVLRTKHDASFFIDLADVFSGGAITRMLEEVLPRAVGGIGLGAFGDIAIFATDAVPEPQAFAIMDIDGPVDVWPSGLGIPAHLVARSVTSSFPLPEYLWGHAENREFHERTCSYGRFIKRPVRLPTWMRAVELGYNGCWHCQREYNVVAIGQLFVDVVGSASSMPKVTARLVSDVQRFGVTVRPRVEELSGQLGWNVSTGSRLYQSVPLVPGVWEVAAAEGDWSIITTVQVGRAWRSEGEIHGTATMVHAEVGSSDVSVEMVQPRV
ncbi:hypothetical protein FXF53_21005 [Micromonospora sp. WP24]|uniref:hypothetical protein n=1 Tax=Micromonospora sp. WP24 TaxID=2604469 RepID=UPI0011DB3564|nr:hypothetical protein [Micromonospora sp. WP24]TYB96889.1 hypothetical protein FXF53_21005 [Micromonospora sp. WP24]